MALKNAGTLCYVNASAICSAWVGKLVNDHRAAGGALATCLSAVLSAKKIGLAQVLPWISALSCWPKFAQTTGCW